MTFHNAFDGSKVLVTGHTGFKGTWMTMWLQELGAEVVGLRRYRSGDEARSIHWRRTASRAELVVREREKDAPRQPSPNNLKRRCQTLLPVHVRSARYDSPYFRAKLGQFETNAP